MNGYHTRATAGMPKSLSRGTSSGGWALRASLELVLVLRGGLASLPLAVVLLYARALDRLTVRRRFEERFSVERMARTYPALYGTVLHRDAAGAALGLSLELTRRTLTAIVL